MAKIGRLVDVVSRALGLPRETVVSHGRNLRESGLLSSKGAERGRGRGAAEMTFEDAAKLLLVVVASEATRDSVKTLQIMTELERVPGQSFTSTDKTVVEAIVNAMQRVGLTRAKGRLHPGYLRQHGALWSEAALTFHSVLGVDSGKYPRIVHVRDLLSPGSRNTAPAAALQNRPRLFGSFLTKGWPADQKDLSAVVGTAPGLLQTRYVSFPAFADIAFAVDPNVA
jgi:hypothetical protein